VKSRSRIFAAIALGVVAGITTAVGLGELAARHVMKVDPPGGLDEAEAKAKAAPDARWWAESAQPAALTPLPLVTLPQRADRFDEPPAPVERTVLASKGDTLIDLFLRAGASSIETHDAIDAIRSVFNPRNIKPGLALTFTFTPADAGRGHLLKVSLPSGIDQTVKLERGSDDDEFSVSTIARPLSREVVRSEGVIRSSLYEDGVAAGLPAPLLAELIRAFSYDVDFQREIQPGDRFEVAYERFLDSRERVAKSGNIIYAALTLSGRTLKIYRYAPKGGAADYFNEKGESVRKALLRTPVDGARITSGFGMRMHPILGYSMMHKGIDFGVPAGTPIMAAGDGVVEVAGANGSYGNYVRIRHNDQYSTAYAHMSRIAGGIRPGAHVRQGQVIGFVGATGRATGPHLHYEVLVHEHQINPASVKLPTGIKLAGAELKDFEASRARMDGGLANLPMATKLARTTF
jgi:murein DD-endopeptidase MepM/ murein hydrolase activator NlpD